jgi:hypothetical protein
MNYQKKYLKYKLKYLELKGDFFMLSSGRKIFKGGVLLSLIEEEKERFILF